MKPILFIGGPIDGTIKIIAGELPEVFTIPVLERLPSTLITGNFDNQAVKVQTETYRLRTITADGKKMHVYAIQRTTWDVLEMLIEGYRQPAANAAAGVTVRNGPQSCLHGRPIQIRCRQCDGLEGL